MKMIDYQLQQTVPPQYFAWANKNNIPDAQASELLGMYRGCMYTWKRKNVKPSARAVVAMMEVMK